MQTTQTQVSLYCVSGHDFTGSTIMATINHIKENINKKSLKKKKIYIYIYIYAIKQK